MLQKNLNAFDDYTPLSEEEFYHFVFGHPCLSFEIGDGVGLTTLVFDGINAYVQMVMFDWRFREYIGREICNIAFEYGAERVTATVSDDRGAATEYVMALGFEHEGRMRNAFLRQGIKCVDQNPVHDIHVWGLAKEKWYGDGSSDRSSGGSSIGCGVSGVGSVPGESGGSGGAKAAQDPDDAVHVGVREI